MYTKCLKFNIVEPSPHYQLKFYWDGQESLSNTEKVSSQLILSFER